MSINERKQYFFNDVNDLASYIEGNLKNPTPLKIQKTLYFLWAFYAASYGDIDYSQQSEFMEEVPYPKELFKAKFEAWKYGPVLNKVYAEYKGDSLKPTKARTPKPTSKMENDVWDFIDDMISQVNGVNDFGLVARSHQDSAWQKAYKEGQSHCLMDNNEIIKDYKKYVSQ